MRVPLRRPHSVPTSPYLVLQDLDLLLHLRQRLVTGLYEVYVLVPLVLDHVVERGELLQTVAGVVVALREVCYYQLLYLHLAKKS